jgi:hypothetical protein
MKVTGASEKLSPMTWKLLLAGLALGVAPTLAGCMAPGQSGRSVTTVVRSPGAAHIEAEDMKRTGGNTLSRPGWGGTILYENKDALRTNFTFGAVGRWRVDIRGSSSDKHPAGVTVFIDDQARASGWFTSKKPQVLSLVADVDTAGGHEVRLGQTTDVGENDAWIDWIEVRWAGPLMPAPVLPTTGAVASGHWRNLFVERGYPEVEVAHKIEEAWQTLFHGDPDNQAVYFEKGQNADGPLAYVMDIGNGDVRSEGMSYGMMVAVQLDHKHEFDALWNWACSYMAHPDPKDPVHGYFSWQMKPNGKIMDPMPAPDGEQYFVTALYFAHARWGSGKGIYDYRTRADQLLRDIRSREDIGGVTSEFNRERRQPRFTPNTVDFASIPIRRTTCRRSTKSGPGSGRPRKRGSGARPRKAVAISSSARRALPRAWYPTMRTSKGGPNRARTIRAAATFATTRGGRP